MFKRGISKEALAKFEEALVDPDLQLMHRLESEKAALKTVIEINKDQLKAIRYNISKQLGEKELKRFGDIILLRPNLKRVSQIYNIFHIPVKKPRETEEEIKIEMEEAIEQRKRSRPKWVSFVFKGRFYDRIKAMDGIKAIADAMNVAQAENKLINPNAEEETFTSGGLMEGVTAFVALSTKSRKNIIHDFKSGGYKPPKKRKR